MPTIKKFRLAQKNCTLSICLHQPIGAGIFAQASQYVVVKIDKNLTNYTIILQKHYKYALLLEGTHPNIPMHSYAPVAPFLPNRAEETGKKTPMRPLRIAL